jgi:hypothetical protein
VPVVLINEDVRAKEALVAKLELIAKDEVTALEELIAKLELPNKEPVNDPVNEPVNEAPINLEPENILEVTALVTNKAARLASDEPEVIIFFQDGIQLRFVVRNLALY